MHTKHDFYDIKFPSLIIKVRRQINISRLICYLITDSVVFLTFQSMLYRIQLLKVHSILIMKIFQPSFSLKNTLRILMHSVSIRDY